MFLLTLIHIPLILASVSDAHTGLLDKLAGKIDGTRKDVNAMLNHLSTRVVGSAPATSKQRIDIPLNPQEEDFPFLEHWRQGPWQSTQNTPQTDADDSDGQPVYSVWMEDQFGEPISEDIKTAIHEDIYSYWSGMFMDNKISLQMAPKDVAFRFREEFRIAMEGKYPWLRLCAAHWKVRQLWTNYFSKWKRRARTLQKTANRTVISIPTSDKSTGGNIVIEAPTSDEGSTGSKRGRPDEINTNPSKKHKGKGVARPTVPSQPQKHQKPKPKARLNTVKVSIVLDSSQGLLIN